MKTTQDRFNTCKRAGLSLALVASLTQAAGSTTAVAKGTDNRTPYVPAILTVGDTNRVHFHAYAIGAQVYTWVVNPTNGALSSWVLLAPDAILFDADGNIVGRHYAGPTWESNSGSKVVGMRVQGVMVDPTAIPWLLLAKKSTSGNGIFADVTYVQRVNTFEGLPPSTRGTTAGQIARVAYTAEYYFYRESN